MKTNRNKQLKSKIYKYIAIFIYIMEFCNDTIHGYNEYADEYTGDNTTEHNNVNENSQETPDIYNLDYNLYIIEWIHEYVVDCNFVFTRMDMYTNIIYNSIINRLKEVAAKYFEIKEDIDYHSLHYLYNPEDLLDEAFYCRGQNKFWFKNYNEVKELLDKFELMSYTIYNNNNAKLFDN
jgi:hypothetical protein